MREEHKVITKYTAVTFQSVVRHLPLESTHTLHELAVSILASVNVVIGEQKVLSLRSCMAIFSGLMKRAERSAPASGSRLPDDVIAGIREVPQILAGVR